MKEWGRRDLATLVRKSTTPRRETVERKLASLSALQARVRPDLHSLVFNSIKGLVQSSRPTCRGVMRWSSYSVGSYFRTSRTPRMKKIALTRKEVTLNTSEPNEPNGMEKYAVGTQSPLR